MAPPSYYTKFSKTNALKKTAPTAASGMMHRWFITNLYLFTPVAISDAAIAAYGYGMT